MRPLTRAGSNWIQSYTRKSSVSELPLLSGGAIRTKRSWARGCQWKRPERPADGRMTTAASMTPALSCCISPSESPWTARTTSSGYLRRTSCSAGGSVLLCTVRIVPSTTRPETIGLDLCRNASSAASASRVLRASSRASGVGCATRAERTNRGCPRCSSRRLTCKLTALGVRPISSAAAAKLPRRRIASRVARNISFIEFSLWIAEQNVVSKDFVTVIDCIEHIGIRRLEATEQEPSSHELDRRIRCERSVLHCRPSTRSCTL